MIIQYDLYDISYAFMLIRNDIQNSFNSQVLTQIICVLENKESESGFNQIRQSIAVIEGIDTKRWNYVYHDNVYVNVKILKKEHIYITLINFCKELLKMIKAGEYERAYDLADCIHCLPDIIADNDFTIPKSFWKSYVKPYRKKWDNSFGIVEQKLK